MGLKLHKLFILAMAMMSVLASCSDNNDEPSAENQDESGPVEAFDDLRWFEDNLVYSDSEGNIVEYIYGRKLDPASPRTIFVGVDSENEASQIFKGWLSPGSESRITELSDGSMRYFPEDKNGESQGEIDYNVNKPGDDDAIAVVTFSENTKVRYINEIRFIYNDLWPENASVINPYSVGDIVDFDTDANYSRHPWNGWQKGVCVREATNNQNGLIVYISANTFGDWEVHNHEYPELASPAVAKEVSKCLRGNWKFFVNAFKDAGCDLSETNYYWINDRRIMPFARYAIRLKDSNIDWFDMVFRRPYKPIIMVRTFGVIIV